MIKKTFNVKEYFKTKKVVLAPMAGITSFAYRQFYRNHGASLTYTEMISDCGLIYGNEETKKLLYSNNDESPLALQLFGGTKENLIKAIKIIESMNIEYDILDLNLACPVYKVTRNNGGSARLKDLNLLKDMIDEVVKTSQKPVSCKIRLGRDDSRINVYEVCKILEDAGVVLIAIHCRTTKQGYTGFANYSVIKDLKKVINLPILVSGDIFSVEKAIEAIEITAADGVLLARGGIGNPLLFNEIQNYFDTGKIMTYSHDFEIQKKLLFEFMDILIKEKGEDLAIRLLRGIGPKFFNTFPNSKNIRKALSTEIYSKEDVCRIVEQNKPIEI